MSLQRMYKTVQHSTGSANPLTKTLAQTSFEYLRLSQNFFRSMPETYEIMEMLVVDNEKLANLFGMHSALAIKEMGSDFDGPKHIREIYHGSPHLEKICREGFNLLCSTLSLYGKIQHEYCLFRLVSAVSVHTNILPCWHFLELVRESTGPSMLRIATTLSTLTPMSLVYADFWWSKPLSEIQLLVAVVSFIFPRIATRW